MKTLYTLALIGSLPVSYAIAQSDGQYESNAAAAQPFWHVTADPATRSTTVQIFGAERKLIYEEVLPGRYIKLNDQSMTQLDQLVNQLTDQKLVISSIKTRPLRSESDFYRPRRERKPDEATPPAELMAPEALQLDAFALTSQNKLLVHVRNPEGYRVHVAIRDSQGQNVINDSAVQTAYNRVFDLTELLPGDYLLTLSNHNSKIRRTRTLHITGQAIIVAE